MDLGLRGKTALVLGAANCQTSQSLIDAWGRLSRSSIRWTTWSMTQGARRRLRPQGGRIITSTFSGVVAPIANLGLSNALRLSLVGWSKTLAREVGRDGVTVNVVVPGANRHTTDGRPRCAARPTRRAHCG